jgi:hypothetical protein
MSVIIRYANFVFKKENHRLVLFLSALIALLGGLSGAIISLPIASVHTTSLKLRLATINDGDKPAHALISTKPIYVSSNDDLRSVNIDCVAKLKSQRAERLMPVITISNVPRGSETLLVSITKKSTSYDCLEEVGKALVNDQNRRLAEYTEIWKTEKDILESRLSQQDQQNSEALRVSSDRVLKVPAREPVFEELYKVKWLLASARESMITQSPLGSDGYVRRQIFLFGMYGMLSACSGLLVVLLALRLMLFRQKKSSAEKNSYE